MRHLPHCTGDLNGPCMCPPEGLRPLEDPKPEDCKFSHCAEHPNPDPRFELGYRPGETKALHPDEWNKGMAEAEEDWVNPSHYNENGPTIKCPNCGDTRTLRCIEVMRGMLEPRLATAFRYIWRVAFGGKKGQPPERDVDKAKWYLDDWLKHPPEIKP